MLDSGTSLTRGERKKAKRINQGNTRPAEKFTAAKRRAVAACLETAAVAAIEQLADCHEELAIEVAAIDYDAPREDQWAADERHVAAMRRSELRRRARKIRTAKALLRCDGAVRPRSAVSLRTRGQHGRASGHSTARNSAASPATRASAGDSGSSGNGGDPPGEGDRSDASGDERSDEEIAWFAAYVAWLFPDQLTASQFEASVATLLLDLDSAQGYEARVRIFDELPDRLRHSMREDVRVRAAREYPNRGGCRCCGGEVEQYIVVDPDEICGLCWDFPRANRCEPDVVGGAA